MLYSHVHVDCCVQLLWLLSTLSVLAHHHHPLCIVVQHAAFVPSSSPPTLPPIKQPTHIFVSSSSTEKPPLTPHSPHPLPTPPPLSPQPLQVLSNIRAADKRHAHLAATLQQAHTDLQTWQHSVAQHTAHVAKLQNTIAHAKQRQGVVQAELAAARQRVTQLEGDLHAQEDAVRGAEEGIQEAQVLVERLQQRIDEQGMVVKVWAFDDFTGVCMLWLYYQRHHRICSNRWMMRGGCPRNSSSI